MSRRKEWGTLIVGVLVGLALAPTAAQAVNKILTATPSTQVFIVDGRQVELEAYAINGNNYVKLRDVGQLVNFDVAYDPARNAAIIESGKPYTGEDVCEAPSNQPPETMDYDTQANPTIFTADLTREVYNGIRDVLLHESEVVDGSRHSPSLGKVPTAGKADQAMGSISRWPLYGLSPQSDGTSVCELRQPDAYKSAAQHTQSFVDNLTGLAEKEKVEAIDAYVCDRLRYSVEYPSPAKVLSQDDEVPGCCMAYAYSFQFLCNQAGIPCILVQNDLHQWNKVYVEGRWWDVDLTSDDSYDSAQREGVVVLHAPGEMMGRIYQDSAPDVTIFCMELLAPGSTR